MPAIGVDTFLSIQNEWIQFQGDKCWDTSREKAILAVCDARDWKALTADHALICDVTCAESSMHFEACHAKTAKNWQCPRCLFAENMVGADRCNVCHASGRKWKCYGCSNKNTFSVQVCAICSTSADRSAAIRGFLDRIQNPQKEEGVKEGNEEDGFVCHRKAVKVSYNYSETMWLSTSSNIYTLHCRSMMIIFSPLPGRRNLRM